MAKASTTKGNGFVHLHVHSHYSLLDGACSIGGLLDRAVGHDMGALAITDHGNMFGALEFYRVARGRGVKPIIGTEAYVAPKSRFEKKRAVGQENYWHMLLLAKNSTGYANLVKLASAAYKEGFYYRPRIDKELLREYGDGLIATSGCLQGEVNQALLRGDMPAAETAAREYRDIFGKGNFYLEVQDHGIEEQRRINPGIRELGDKLKIPLVATNDLHYLDKGHAHAHDVLLCIATGKLYHDPARWRFDGEEFWFKGEKEMRIVLPEFHDAIDHTVEIASKCDLEIKLGEARFPPYKSGKKIPNEKYLRQLCLKGLKERYGDSPSQEAKDRLDHELEVIKGTGFLDYFLVVWDLIHAARSRGIPMGPGRGSAAGSLVAYVLRITDVCPLRFDLLFDRFLNAARNEPPDIDIDICQAGRGEMIEYLREKYGRENTAQIITFGTLAARRAVRDVGRVLDVPLNEVDRLAKLIPATPGMKLKDAVEESADLKEALDTDSRAKQLYGLSEQLEGLARNAGTHAAAIVISDRPLDEEVPLYVKDGEVSTQYQMNDVGALGLLKLDLLGLETLTALEECLRVIEEVHGSRPELPVDELDDPKVFELLQRGESTGLFQLESDGMRTLLKQLKPDSFEDIIAVLALYRPGPLGSGMVESYVKRKHGEEKLKYLHKKLEPILSETNGVILYQEQVMRIANRIAGFSLSEADTLRKAMGKKKVEVMDKFSAQFLGGCEENDVPRAIGQEIWDQMVYFAGYGFNKSHSTAYGLVSYQTAWVKAHYPAEFIAAMMTIKRDNTDRLVLLAADCRTFGIELLPPDVNESRARFFVEEGKIRFGLSAVKGVGTGAAEGLAAAAQKYGPFKHLVDITENVDLTTVNKSALEALILSGAMDHLDGHRSQLAAALEDAVKIGASSAKDKARGQGGLFGETEKPPPPPLPRVPAWPEAKRLADEKELTGLYHSSHPLARYERTITSFSNANVLRLKEMDHKAEVTMGGLLRGLRLTVTKSGRNPGQRMALFELEDLTGVVKCVIFPRDFERARDFIIDDQVVFLRASIDQSREDPNLKVADVMPIDRAREILCQRVIINLQEKQCDQETVDALCEAVRQSMGNSPVYLRIHPKKGDPAVVKAGYAYGVAANEKFDKRVAELLGAEAVEYL